MSVIDLEKLLSEISAESPCGDDLEYDPAFGEIERAAQGKPEQEMGDSVVPAEEPDWKSVKKQTLEIFGRTRDLRLALYLTHALVHTDGPVGFADGLALLRGLLEKWWEPMHPHLDPDDDNDPTMRVNTLSALADRDAIVKSFREAPLVTARGLGSFSLKDVQVADGTLPWPTDAEDTPPDLSTIDGAFLDGDLEELQAVEAALGASQEHVKAIEVKLTELVGAAQSMDFSPLGSELLAAQKVVQDRLARRGVGSGAEAEAEGGVEGAVGGPKPITGEISSREDVIRVLDKACDYFHRNEPASPVPILLQRAKRLVNKDFLEIMRDLAPSGVHEVENIRGLESEQQ